MNWRSLFGRQPAAPPREDAAARTPRWKKARRDILAILLVLVLMPGLLFIMGVFDPRPSDVARVSFSELSLALASPGKIDTLWVVTGRSLVASGKHPLKGKATTLEASYPAEEYADLIADAKRGGAVVVFEKSAENLRALLGLVEFLLFLLVVVYFVRRSSGNTSGQMDLGSDERSATTFADVAGVDAALEELTELVSFLKEPERYQKLGARTNKGILLAGPPGCGKTLLARAVAGEAGVPFFAISGSEVTGFLVGLGAARIRKLFKKAKREGGVIFIDEIDALGGTRGRIQAHNEDDRSTNQLLVELDGFVPSDGVVVIGATNRPESLDPALRRAGRIDRNIFVTLPDVKGREAILRLHATRRGVPLAPDVDLARLARLMVGASGADLANLINESAMAAARTGASEVRWQHVDLARDRLLLGKERRGAAPREKDLRTVAYHEAGHAIAGTIHCGEDGLHKVTIQPRGSAMGVAHFMPDGDVLLYSRSYLRGQIIKALGGRAAEEIIFGAENITSGAESDLQHANHVARGMTLRWAMNGDGSLLVDSPDAPLTEPARRAREQEADEMLRDCYKAAKDTLNARRCELEALAAMLLEEETVDGDKVRDLLGLAEVDASRAAQIRA